MKTRWELTALGALGCAALFGACSGDVDEAADRMMLQAADLGYSCAKAGMSREGMLLYIRSKGELPVMTRTPDGMIEWQAAPDYPTDGTIK